MRNVLTLMSGTTISQALPIIISPILTRIYSPSEFGLLALYVSIASLIAVISTGRYELAIMLPKKDEEAINVSVISCIITIIISCITFIVVILSHQQIAKLLGNNDVSYLLLFIPISVLNAGFSQTLNYWCNRKNEYKSLAINGIIQSIVIVALNLSFGLLGYSALGLILGSILGQTTYVMILSCTSWRGIKPLLKFLSIESMKKELNNYSDFPKKSTIGAFFNILSSQSPLLLINFFYSESILGVYSLTLRVLNSPMSILGKSISQVFYQKANEANHDGTLPKLVKRTTTNLFVIIFIPMTILLLFGNQLFAFIFGEEWRISGIIAQIMAPFFLIRFIFSCQSTVLMIKRKLNFELKFNMYFFISQVLSVIIGYFLLSNYFAVFFLMSLSGFICFLYLGISIKKIIEEKPLEVK